MILSPTGSLEIRMDGWGQGSYGAPRGNRSHSGVDLVCVPKQVILAPITGTVVREAFPYAGDLKWAGCLIVGDQIEVKMFYMRLYHHLRKDLPQHCTMGMPIGLAQDISSRYNHKPEAVDFGEMIPHVHLEMKLPQKANPMNHLEVA